METHTQIVNRMHSVAHRHHLKHERGKRFNEKNTGWQKDKRLSQMEQFQLELEMENRSYLEKQIEGLFLFYDQFSSFFFSSLDTAVNR